MAVGRISGRLASTVLFIFGLLLAAISILELVYPSSPRLGLSASCLGLSLISVALALSPGFLIQDPFSDSHNELATRMPFLQKTLFGIASGILAFGVIYSLFAHT